MFITYHRIGRSAVLPALAAAGVFFIVGGIAAIIAVTTLAVVGVAVVGIRLLHALGLGETKRPVTFQADNTIEGVVVNRSTDGLLNLTQQRGLAPSRAAGPRERTGS